MRGPRWQFSLRRMMIAVALAALVFGGEATRRRWSTLSSAYRVKAALFESRAMMAARGRSEAEVLNVHRKGEFQRLADHYDALALKYDLAARFPWLPIGPDPPEPLGDGGPGHRRSGQDRPERQAPTLPPLRPNPHRRTDCSPP